MLSIRLLLLIGFVISSTTAIAGTILLMGIGTGAPGGGTPPPPCSNSLDFTDQCNSQYITVI